LVVYCLFLVEEKEQRKVLTVQEREKVQAAVQSKDGRMWELKSIVSHWQGTYSLENDLPGCEAEGAPGEAPMSASASSPDVSCISSL